MGKKYDALMAQLAAAYKAMNTPSPYETQLSNELSNLNKWLDAGDYRHLPQGLSIPMLSLADSQKLRQMTRGSLGQAAAGVQNPNLLAQQRELDDNRFAQEEGNEYSGAINDLINRKYGLLSDLQGQYSNRMRGGVEGATAMLNAYQNRPRSGWGNILGNMIGAGASIATKFI